MAATSFVFSRLGEAGDERTSGSIGARVLLVDSVPTSSEVTGAILKAGWHKVTTCTSTFEAVAHLQKGIPVDVVLVDCADNSDGLDALASIKRADANVPVIVLSRADNTRAIARTIRLGAHDCLSKPYLPSDLQHAIRECIQTEKQPSPECLEQEVQLQNDTSFVFASKKMWEIRAQCSLIARVDLPVLILGESGTGKEVLAQFIHKTSQRANRTFLKVNCAAVPADLLESELFGYEQGAFTGATRSKPGMFELCNHGTILLDEIGEMPAEMQAKLLQVLQDGTFARLGSRSSLKVDVRVIAATNIDIRSAIAQKTFREDLYYRLNGFNITLPPLRERREEIPVLFRYFMRKFAGKYNSETLTPSEELVDACTHHTWPGNLRELENFVRRFLVLGNEQLMLAELGPQSRSTVHVVGNRPTTLSGGLKKLVRGVKGEAEMQAIGEALQNSGWNRKLAAADLKISYKALLYKVRQYGIRFPEGY
jgi:two-component system, NtrC family, response regulator AtoC